jgi:hypothetical protein
MVPPPAVESQMVAPMGQIPASRAMSGAKLLLTIVFVLARKSALKLPKTTNGQENVAFLKLNPAAKLSIAN